MVEPTVLTWVGRRVPRLGKAPPVATSCNTSGKGGNITFRKSLIVGLLSPRTRHTRPSVGIIQKSIVSIICFFGNEDRRMAPKTHPFHENVPWDTPTKGLARRGVLSTFHLFYLTQSVFKVVLQKSTPPQIREVVLYYY